HQVTGGADAAEGLVPGRRGQGPLRGVFRDGETEGGLSRPSASGTSSEGDQANRLGASIPPDSSAGSTLRTWCARAAGRVTAVTGSRGEPSVTALDLETAYSLRLASGPLLPGRAIRNVCSGRSPAGRRTSRVKRPTLFQSVAPREVLPAESAPLRGG